MTVPRKKPTVMVLFGWSDPEGFVASAPALEAGATTDRPGLSLLVMQRV